MNPGPTRCHHRILLIEDEETLRIPLRDYLSERCLEVVAFRDAESAFPVMVPGAFDVVVTDLRLPGADGFAVLKAVRASMPDCQVVLMTAYGTVDAAVRAIREGAYDFVTKPFQLEEMGALLDRICQTRRLAEENRELRDELAVTRAHGDLVAESPAMQAVLRNARVVAGSDAPLVLTGETGTGKEVLADLIHASSDRRAGRLVKVNCAALPDALFESEMFGHEKGAFTGATERRRGRFEMADGGTLFLDEVVDLPAAAQTKLLRVLQEGTFERVGSSQPLSSNFRLICAAQRDLRDEVAAGRLREDLYYRMAVLTLAIPPLRERIEDVAPLARQFIRAACRKARQPEPTLGPDALAALTRYSFPGNVRELKNLMEAATVLCEGGVIGAAHLPPWVTSGKTNGDRTVAGIPPGLPLEEAVARFERAYIEQTLVETQGRKEEAARRLGISRKTLWQKLRDSAEDEPGEDVTSK